MGRIDHLIQKRLGHLVPLEIAIILELLHLSVCDLLLVTKWGAGRTAKDLLILLGSLFFLIEHFKIKI